MQCHVGGLRIAALRERVVRPADQVEIVAAEPFGANRCTSLNVTTVSGGWVALPD
jgi:hypothetical protein